MEIEAPHNEFQYAVFGRVTKGDDTLRKLERLPTHKEGIFVMVCILQLHSSPRQRIFYSALFNMIICILSKHVLLVFGRFFFSSEAM
jgi:hypothetical protein